MRLAKRFFAIAAVILLSNTMTLSATEQNKNIKTVYPVASAILMEAYRYLGSLESFSFDAITTNDDIYRDLMRQEFTHKVHVDLQRPDKLKLHISGDVKNRSTYIFHDQFTVLDHDLNFYGELHAEKTIDKTLDHLFEKYEMRHPLANLLYTDLDKRVPPKENGYYLGMTQVDGKMCHHIGFTNAHRELQVWIERGQSPLIKKFSIIDKSEKLDLRSTTLLRWNINPQLQDKDFLFEAPEDASKISVLLKRSE